MAEALAADARREIEAHGLTIDEAERQLALLRDPPPPADLVRACVRGDGIRALETHEHARLEAAADRVVAAGRVTKMVPASGAATRMFHTLLRARAGGDPIPARRLLRELRRFPFYAALAAIWPGGADALDRAAEAGDPAPVLDVLLGGAGDADGDRTASGLGLADRPKALIPFHVVDGVARTAFDEHLAEAAGHLADDAGRVRAHVTVGAAHRSAFDEALAQGLAPTLAEELGVTFDVGFSVQRPSTDTLALGADDAPMRAASGDLLFRPGGHGALIDNLHALATGSAAADLVLIRNIDNVQPPQHRGVVVRWQRRLLGLLAELQARIHNVLDRLDEDVEILDDPRWRADVLDFVADGLGVPEIRERADASSSDLAAALRDALDRPLRVCGMVPNEGEPGGGPYWVRGASGRVRRQIVESAQIDSDDPAQAAIVAGATHFNPVDLACALRDRAGAPYDLARYVDPQTAFVADKSLDGRPLRALERPGLWNGAMAGWLTVFVEVPAATFAPVKTIFDLLRSEHQP
ncbi:MAG: DUF4301 family protein [Acidobacteriota bacterium]